MGEMKERRRVASNCGFVAGGVMFVGACFGFGALSACLRKLRRGFRKFLVDTSCAVLAVAFRIPEEGGEY